MARIFLSPSNQAANTYAYGGTTEDVQCGRIAAACKTALERCGFQVALDHHGSLADKTNASDAFQADLHVPIHTNAYNGSVSGTRLMAYNTTGAGYKACQAIMQRLAPITPGTSDSITARPSLYEIKNPKAPTAYIEVDFHDVPSVARWIIEHTGEIGEAIAAGICDYFGKEYKPQEKVLYRVQVGAFADKANAETCREKLVQAGFPGAYITTK